MSVQRKSQVRVLSLKIQLPLGVTAKEARRLLKASLGVSPEQIVKEAVRDAAR